MVARRSSVILFCWVSILCVGIARDSQEAARAKSFVKHALALVNNRLARSLEDEKAELLLEICGVFAPDDDQVGKMWKVKDSGKRPESGPMTRTSRQLGESLAKIADGMRSKALTTNGAYGDIALYSYLIADRFAKKNPDILAGIEILRMNGFDKSLDELRKQKYDLKDIARSIIPPPLPQKLDLEEDDLEIAKSAALLAQTRLAVSADDSIGAKLIRFACRVTPRSFSSFRVLASSKAGIPIEKAKKAPHPQILALTMLKRVRVLDKMIAAKKKNPVALRALYLRFAALLNPKDKKTADLVSKLDESDTPFPLDDLLSSDVDLNGIFGDGDWSRVTRILGDAYKQRSAENRKTLMAHFRLGERSEQCITRAKRWLASVQSENGSWGSPANTAWALMVFLGDGELPGSKIYGKNVSSGIKYLVGYVNNHWVESIPANDQATCRDLPIITTALAEAYGLTDVQAIRKPVVHLVNHILSRQQKEGFFGPSFTKTELWDTTVTAWCIEALQAARMSGIDSDRVDEALKKCEQFCVHTAFSMRVGRMRRNNDDEDVDPGNKAKKGKAKPSANSQGACILYLCGERDAKTRSILRRVMKTVYRDTMAQWKNSMGDQSTWIKQAKKSLVQWHFANIAMLHHGVHDRREWMEWAEMMENLNSKIQRTSGCWPIAAVVKGEKPPPLAVYATALCTLQLQVVYRFPSAKK